jgi:hypothetical protein
VLLLLLLVLLLLRQRRVPSPVAWWRGGQVQALLRRVPRGEPLSPKLMEIVNTTMYHVLDRVERDGDKEVCDARVAVVCACVLLLTHL